MRNEAWLEVLLKTEPFTQLDKAHLNALGRKVVFRRFESGDYIFRQGDTSCDCLFIIAEGLVEILIENNRHTESVVGLRGPYDFFGETVVLSGQRYPGSARAKEAAACLCIDRNDLESLIYSHPEFSGFFNTLLAERMRLLYERYLAEQSCGTPPANIPLLFRNQVSRVMSTPVLTCLDRDPVSLAARKMMQRQVGCLVVTDAAGQFQGILTERHLVDGLVADPIGPVDRCTVAALMESRPATVAPGTYLGEALAVMVRNRTRQLVVMEQNTPVGVIAFSDLLRAQSAASLMLIHDITDQTTLDGLARLSTGIDRVLDALVAERAGVRETMEIMSRLNDRITRKVIELCEAHMQTDGWGPPPVDYCWINMGSAARYEQTLRTDQDNAIIYADASEVEAPHTKQYFQHLGRQVVDGLARCGFERCRGGVMASKSDWCRPISQWRDCVRQWMTSVDPKDIRNLTILLDFRSVWGTTRLTESLWQEIVGSFSKSASAGHLLWQDDRKLAAPIGFWGRINTERSGPQKGRINLKTAALVHVINIVRLLAVSRNIFAPSTLERLDRLADSGHLSVDDASFYKTCFETLMMFKIRENLKRVREGEAPDNTLDPGQLTKGETLLLKDALSAVAQLQKRFGKGFQIPWMNYFGQ